MIKSVSRTKNLSDRFFVGDYIRKSLQNEEFSDEVNGRKTKTEDIYKGHKSESHSETVLTTSYQV